LANRVKAGVLGSVIGQALLAYVVHSLREQSTAQGSNG
jgi:hypothetical protein